MDIHYHFDAREARDIIRRATAAGATVTERETAFHYLIDASRSFDAKPDVLLLVLQHLPELAAGLEQYSNEANDVVWDVVDSEHENVRVAGYHAAAQVAAQTRSTDLVRINMDLLIQLLMQVTSTSTSLAEAAAMKSALKAMLPVDPLAYIEVIVDNITDFDGADSKERRAAVWDFVLDDLRNALMELFAQPDTSTFERTFIDGVEKSLSTETASAVRVEALHLLLALPGLTGARSTAKDATWLLRQIIQSSLLEGDGAATIPYLDLMDELERVATYKPDVRWYLYMFCKHPVTTMEWAHKGYILETETSPSRLIDWLLAGWSLWQREQRNGPEAVAGTPAELRFTRLGVEIAKTTLRQIPMIVPAGVSSTSIKRQMESLEVHLIIVYFIFVKFRGKIDALHTDETNQRLVDIATAAEQGLTEAMTIEKSSISLRRWENVVTMSKNLVEGKAFTTVVPSWKPLPLSNLKPQDTPTLSQPGPASAPAVVHLPQPPGLPFSSQRGKATLNTQSNIPTGPRTQPSTFASRQTDTVSSAPLAVGRSIQLRSVLPSAGRQTAFDPGHSRFAAATQQPLRLPPRQPSFRPPPQQPASMGTSTRPVLLTIKGSAADQARPRTPTLLQRLEMSPGSSSSPPSAAKRSWESEGPSTETGYSKRHRSAVEQSSARHDHSATDSSSSRLTDRPPPISLARRTDKEDPVETGVKRKGRGFQKDLPDHNDDLLINVPTDRTVKPLLSRLMPVPPTSPFTSNHDHR